MYISDSQGGAYAPPVGQEKILWGLEIFYFITPKKFPYLFEQVQRNLKNVSLIINKLPFILIMFICMLVGREIFGMKKVGHG